jgi:hypothetical protein
MWKMLLVSSLQLMNAGSEICYMRGQTDGQTGRQILVTLMMEALSSSETSILIGTTRRNILEDANLHSHLRDNFKSYILEMYFIKLF